MGKGTYTTPDGNSYNGYFKNDKFDGAGVLTFKSGSSYKGEFKNG